MSKIFNDEKIEFVESVPVNANRRVAIGCVILGGLCLIPFIGFFLFFLSIIFCGICERKFYKLQEKTNLLLSRIGLVLSVLGGLIVSSLLSRGF